MGLLKDLRGKPMPPNGYDCVRKTALDQLVKYLNDNFDTIYQTIRSSNKNASTPLYLNCYDTPVARDAPAIRGRVGPWLYSAYEKNGIHQSLWADLTAGLFRDIKQTIEGWAAGRQGVVVVPTTGLLIEADPASQGDSGDWVNEIHPNKSGWRKQVQAWLAALPPETV